MATTLKNGGTYCVDSSGSGKVNATATTSVGSGTVAAVAADAIKGTAAAGYSCN